MRTPTTRKLGVPTATEGSVIADEGRSTSGGFSPRHESLARAMIVYVNRDVSMMA
jgi:hypothetical protein